MISFWRRYSWKAITCCLGKGMLTMLPLPPREMIDVDHCEHCDRCDTREETEDEYRARLGLAPLIAEAET